MCVRNRTIECDEFGPRVGNSVKTRDENHKCADLRLTSDNEVSPNNKHRHWAQRVEKITQKIKEVLQFVNSNSGTKDLAGQNTRMLTSCVMLSMFGHPHFYDILTNRSLKDSSPSRQTIDRTLQPRHEKDLREVDETCKYRDLRLNPNEVTQRP